MKDLNWFDIGFQLTLGYFVAKGLVTLILEFIKEAFK